MEPTRAKVDVKRISAELALELWNRAPRTTVFTHPGVLAATAQGVQWWLALESGRPAWVWPVCTSACGVVGSPELCYYVGPFRVDQGDHSPRGRLARDIAVHRELLGVLSAAHGRLVWSTMPGEHELRPWLWYDVGGRRPLAVPRYTATIDITARTSEEELLQRFSTTRRYEARRAAGKGPVRLPPASTERIRALYRDTLAASGAEDAAERRLGEVKALAELAMQGHGQVVTFGIGDDGVAHAVWIVLVAKGRACEVIGASDPIWREQCLNSYGRLHCIMAAQAMGASRYDFVGANSPQRGSDKHSYGAEAELYFDLALDPSSPKDS